MKAQDLLDWVPLTQATSETWIGPSFSQENATRSESFQVAWSTGLAGKFVWQVTIFPDLWEDYVACETVELVLDGTETQLHSIVVLPSSYIAASYVRVIFIPDGNQTATFMIAKRKCPT